MLTPEDGFSPYRWIGYNEGLIYIPGLGSPTSLLDEEDYKVWLCSYKWQKHYNIEYLYAGPSYPPFFHAG